MNIRDLRYLVAVAKYKHFGKAAELCFVSQPALSMQLRKLEDELGVQLFERTNKNVMVTEVGQKIVDKTKDILQQVDDLSVIADDYKDPLAGNIKIGAFPTLAPYFFPHIVPNLKTNLPKLRFLLLEEKTDLLIDKLNNGEIDAAFLALPLASNSEMLEFDSIFEEKFLLAVAKSHPLANKTNVSATDLRNLPLLLLDEGHCLRDQALDVCSLIGTSEQQDFRATSMETLRQMVAAGDGVTLMPKLAISKETDRITYLPFENAPYRRKIALVYRKSSARKTLYSKVVEIIKSSPAMDYVELII